MELKMSHKSPDKVAIAGILLLGSLLLPQEARATFSLGGYAFPKSGAQPESVLVCNTGTGERQSGEVTQSNGVWTATLGVYADDDSVWIKAITQAKDTINETFYRGVAGGGLKGIPTLIANSHSLSIRHVIASIVDSGYGRCISVNHPEDTVYARFQTKLSNSIPRFKTAFDVTELGYQLGDRARIELRLRDSSAVSAGIIEGKFIDADTAPNVTLALNPGNRDVAITRCAGLPDTVDAGDSYPVNVSLRNYSDLRDEDVTVVMTRRRNGVTLDSAATTVSLKPPHFQPDTALVVFPDWQVAPSDSGVNIVSYGVIPSDSVPDNNLRCETTFVRGYVSGIVGGSQNRTVKVLPTVLRAPLDLRRVEGQLHDVLGRRVTTLRLEAGVYYLVTPERTRKLLVVD
jgi:hypothetical protein